MLRIDHRDYFGNPTFLMTKYSMEGAKSAFRAYHITGIRARAAKDIPGLAYVTLHTKLRSHDTGRQLPMLIALPDVRIPPDDLTSGSEVSDFFITNIFSPTHDYFFPGFVDYVYAQFPYEDWATLINGATVPPSRELYRLHKTVAKRWEVVVRDSLNHRIDFERSCKALRELLEEEIPALEKTPPVF